MTDEGSLPAAQRLPEGLTRCTRCGRLQGICQVERDDRSASWFAVDVTCLCYGYACGVCGEGRLPRPLSLVWDERVGELLHVSSIMGRRPCPVCGAANRWERACPELAGREPISD